MGGVKFTLSLTEYSVSGVTQGVSVVSTNYCSMYCTLNHTLNEFTTKEKNSVVSLLQERIFWKSFDFGGKIALEFIRDH